MIIKNDLEKLLETLFLNAYWLIYELEYNKDPYYNYTDSEVKGLIDFCLLHLKPTFSGEYLAESAKSQKIRVLGSK